MCKSKIAGWVLSGLLALLFIGASAPPKLKGGEANAKEFEKIGFTTDQMYGIGIVEIAIAVLFLVPQTSFIGAILLTGYLGGATATHVRAGEPFIPPVVIGVLVWIALGLRRPAVFKLAWGCCGASCPTQAPQESCPPPKAE